MARIATDRELRNMGHPTKEQTLALVGLLALANAFGRVTDEDEMRLDCRQLPGRAAYWVGDLMRVAGTDSRKFFANQQTVVTDRKRRVKARKSNVGLATGRHL